MEVNTLVGAACGPRPRRTTGAPSMSSVHAGLSGSDTLAEVFFGNLAVVACFMLFCPSQGDNVRPFRAFRIDHHNHFAVHDAETDLARVAIDFSDVLTGNREVVPNCIASGEVQPVLLDVELALGLIPCEHDRLYLQNTERAGRNLTLELAGAQVTSARSARPHLCVRAERLVM